MNNKTESGEDELRVIFDQWPKLHLGLEFGCAKQLKILKKVSNKHPLIREQGGIFKKFLDWADPYKQSGLIFFKSGREEACEINKNQNKEIILWSI